MLNRDTPMQLTAGAATTDSRVGRASNVVKKEAGAPRISYRIINATSPTAGSSRCSSLIAAPSLSATLPTPQPLKPPTAQEAQLSSFCDRVPNGVVINY